MAESQLIDEVDEITSETGVSPTSIESEQLQLTHSPGNSDEMLKELLFRQKGLDTLLNRFLEEQTQINLNNNTQMEDLKQCITILQTVEGNQNPAGRTGALASDRGATDTTLGNPWLITKNPGNTHSELENRLFMSAPHKMIANLTSVVPSMESRANPALYSLSSDLNSRPIGRSFVSTFPQQYVQSLEGATHASVLI